MSTTCYRQKTVDGFQSIYNVSERYIVCAGTESAGGYSQCCGPNALCLADGICQGLDPQPGTSGYYMGACTDRSFNDGTVCPTFCTNLAYSNVVYNKSTDLWSCCGVKSGRISCDDPTRFTRQFPSPDELRSMYSRSTASPTATATSSTPVSIATPTSTPKASESSNKLSTGSVAGIAVGSVIGVLLLLAIAYWLWRRRRQRQATSDLSAANNHLLENRDAKVYQDTKDAPPIEVDADPPKVELDATKEPVHHELPS